jgi:hypothetical protein
MFGHLANHIEHHDLKSHNVLHVIGVVSNPVRYQSRMRIAREWIKHMQATPNVVLHLVEATYGDRQPELSGLVKSYLPLQYHQNIWIKEAMINLAVRHLLPADWQYMAWVDCDVFFENQNGWAQETLHQLQHFEVVQPWSDCLDLDPYGGVLQTFKSFGRQHQIESPKQKHPSQPYQYAHSGFAWACTRRLWESLVPVGGLLWWCILGSADHHMAFAMIGEVSDTIHGSMSASFKQKAKEWERMAVRVTNCQVGYVAGVTKHWFHGPKKRRQYRERWSILYDHGFDPDRDLLLNSKGIPELIGKPQLDFEIHKYNLSRSEDSIETY